MADAKLTTSSLVANWKCLAICCIISMANFEFGLDSGVVGALQAVPGFLAVFGYPNQFIPGGYGLETTFQQLITTFPILGALISSLVAGVFSDKFGRKAGLWVACLFVAIGVAIQIPSENKAAVYVGRFVLGLGNGFLTTFSNIYCAEIAPAHLRAIMVGLSTQWILIGSIVAAATTNATQVRFDKSSYQLPLGILFVLPAVLAVALLFVPESPRYLLTRDRPDAARESLQTLRGTSLEPSEFELEFAEMVKGIEEERKIAKTVKPLDMFKGTDLRRTLLAMGTAVADSGGSGAWFLIPYTTYFMIISGIPVQDVFHYFVISTCLGLVACNVGMFVMRHVLGRRAFLMISAVGNALFMLGLAVSTTESVGASFETKSKCIITFCLLHLIWYSFGTGLATRPVSTELVSTKLRAWSFGATQAVSQLIIWLVSFCTPYFINPENMNWGGRYGYIWFGSSIACLIWYYFFLPETKGRSLEEIDEIFENKVATLDFPTYHTKITEQALQEVQNRKLEDGDIEKVPSTKVEEHSS